MMGTGKKTLKHTRQGQELTPKIADQKCIYCQSAKKSRRMYSGQVVIPSQISFMDYRGSLIVLIRAYR
jgi:hypothetical protein